MTQFILNSRRYYIHKKYLFGDPDCYIIDRISSFRSLHRPKTLTTKAQKRVISQQNGTFLNDTKITRMAPLLRSKNSDFINHYEMKNFEGDKIMTLCTMQHRGWHSETPCCLIIFILSIIYFQNSLVFGHMKRAIL